MLALFCPPPPWRPYFQDAKAIKISFFYCSLTTEIQSFGLVIGSISRGHCHVRSEGFASASPLIPSSRRSTSDPSFLTSSVFTSTPFSCCTRSLVCLHFHNLFAPFAFLLIHCRFHSLFSSTPYSIHPIRFHCILLLCRSCWLSRYLVVGLLRCRIVVCGVVAVSLYVPYFVGHSRTLLLGPTEGMQQKYNIKWIQIFISTILVPYCNSRVNGSKIRYQ